MSDPSLNSEIFHSSEENIIEWNTENLITYTDYVSELDYETIYTFNLSSVDITSYRTEKSSDEVSEISILANLPCGVTQFSQNDTQWKNTIMQSCNDTIGNSGCALTSTAMVFRYFSVDTSPSVLNSCLGTSACPLVWSTAASNCSSSKVSWNTITSFSWSSLESDLNSGYPVIIGLASGSNTHFVVAVSGSGSSYSGYTINDPWDGQVKSLSNYSSWSITGLRRYRGTPWCQSGGSCSAPSLSSPSDGHVSSNQTIAFSWSAVSGCTFNGYTFRIKDTSNMDSGGNIIIDTGEGGTSHSSTIGSEWNNRDLYWGVKAANAPNGSNWSVRRFRIEPGSSSNCPSVSGEVRLYDSPNCGGSYATASGLGLWSLASSFNDQAESIAIPGGWSTKIYLHDSESSPSTCITSTDSDLGNNTFSDGSSVSNQATWVRVYDNGSCYTPSVPNAPSLSSPSNGQEINEGEAINLSWSTTGDQYYGEIWGGPAGTQTFGWQTGTSVNIGSQWAGYTYSWHVKAKNSFGESSYSDTRTFTVKPKQPAGLYASAASCTSVNLTWTDQSGNEEGFKVYRNGTYIGSTGANGTSYTDTGASESTSYSYVVKAYRGSIESNSSNTANVTTGACPVVPQPPAMPSNLAISSNTLETITLSWDDNSANENGFNVYKWGYNSISDNWEFIFYANVSAGINSFTDTDLFCAYDYFYQVAAYNDVGESTRSDWIMAEPAACPSVSNDSISAPINIPSVPWEQTFNNSGATRSTTDEPDMVQCNRTAGDYSVWYRYTSPITRDVRLDTIGSNYDTMIGVWSGSPGSLVEITCNDDANGSQSILSFTANADTPYYIGISRYYSHIQLTELENEDIKQQSDLTSQFALNTEFHVYTFSDVASNIWYWKWVEGFYAQGITTGCAANPLRYCPDRAVTRAEMAVFILRAKNGTATPVPTTTDLFADVPVTGKAWMQPWIEQFYNEGITTGCAAGPLQYCPERQVTRAEMAVFVLRAIHGPDYVPQAATGVFSDVPVAGKEWMQPWIQQFYNEGITTGCASSPLRYCPEQSVTRAEMATFIDRAFGYPQLP